MATVQVVKVVDAGNEVYDVVLRNEDKSNPQAVWISCAGNGDAVELAEMIESLSLGVRMLPMATGKPEDFE